MRILAHLLNSPYTAVAALVLWWLRGPLLHLLIVACATVSITAVAVALAAVVFRAARALPSARPAGMPCPCGCGAAR